MGEGESSKLDRRREPRMAAEGRLHATVVDAQRRPVVVLHDVWVVNVSAGGVALSSSVDVRPSTVISAIVGDRFAPDVSSRRLLLEVLDCTLQPDGRYRVRCRVLEGRVPARLLYNWFAGDCGSIPA